MPSCHSIHQLAVWISKPRVIQQVQQSLESAAIVGGGVELEGKSASIKSSSECIQSSNAISFSICFLSFFSCSISFLSCSSRISLTGSRRQLSIDKNERKRDSDEPDAPLLGQVDRSTGEVDVVIRGEECDQANNAAEDGFHQGLAIKAQLPPWRSRFHVPGPRFHPKQTTLRPIHLRMVQVYWSCQGWVARSGSLKSSSSALCW